MPKHPGKKQVAAKIRNIKREGKSRKLNKARKGKRK